MTIEKKTRSKHQPTGEWIRREKRLAIYLRDKFRCAYCRIDLHDAAPQDITLDHLEARANGGMNHEVNLVTACRSCNCSRQSREWAQFASAQAVRRINRTRWIPLNLDLARDLIARRKATRREV